MSCCSGGWPVPGSFSLEAAEAVVGAPDPDAGPGDGSGQPDDVLDGISEMVDLHLVEPLESAADPEGGFASSCRTWPGHSRRNCWRPPARSPRSAIVCGGGAGTW